MSLHEYHNGVVDVNNRQTDGRTDGRTDRHTLSTMIGDVTMTDLPSRTRSDVADDVTAWELSARILGNGNDCDVIVPQYVLPLFPSKNVSAQSFADVSMTSTVENSFIALLVYDGDSICELQKNTSDDIDVSMTTLTRLLQHKRVL
ncbi:hypothetical protein DPMN_007595 [Dreissena polymorpha]|uniref:Uncharacterized protein n=1 Tax=Dreissena polymorpha TaxID=45954 RepID=A0A9D4RYE2_DREPO|nr:hypothetical protein DPMN_007595 [Dreissena polymorpha]